MAMFELKQTSENIRYSKIQISTERNDCLSSASKDPRNLVGGDEANIDNSNHVVGAVLLFPVAFWEE